MLGWREDNSWQSGALGLGHCEAIWWLIWSPLMLRSHLESTSDQTDHSLVTWGSHLVIVKVPYETVTMWRSWGGWPQLDFLWSLVAVQSLSQVRLFVTPWTAAHQASLSFTISQRVHWISDVGPLEGIYLEETPVYGSGTETWRQHTGRGCRLSSWFRHLLGASSLTRHKPGAGGFENEVPWRRKWQPTLLLLPREFHGWRSLLGYSPWGRKESDTERLHSLHSRGGELLIQRCSTLSQSWVLLRDSGNSAISKQVHSCPRSITHHSCDSWKVSLNFSIYHWKHGLQHLLFMAFTWNWTDVGTRGDSNRCSLWAPSYA